MNEKLKEIYDNTIPHSSFLSEDSVMECMRKSHQIGVDEVLSWLKNMDYLTDNMDYIIEEFKNQNQK